MLRRPPVPIGTSNKKRPLSVHASWTQDSMVAGAFSAASVGESSVVAFSGVGSAVGLGIRGSLLSPGVDAACVFGAGVDLAPFVSTKGGVNPQPAAARALKIASMLKITRRNLFIELFC